MKKIFLLLISIALYANAQPLTCVEAMYKTMPLDYYIPVDYVLDSLYESYTDDSEQESWYKKVYWTDNLPDSAILGSTSEYRKVVYNYTQAKSKSGDISVITINNNGELYKTIKYYSSADSISFEITTEYEDGTQRETGYFSLRNDTLFFDKGFYYPDSANKNVCYLQTPKSNNDRKITLDVNGDTIHIFQESTYSNKDLFLIPTNQKGTAGFIKNRPIVNVKNVRYFDLKGRPAKAINNHLLKIGKPIH